MTKTSAPSIQTQLLLLVAALALPVAALLVYSGMRIRAEAMQQARLETQRLADAIVAEQMHLVAGAKQLMSALAQLPEVRSRDPRTGVILKELLRLNPQYANMIIVGLDGRVWASAVDTASFNISDRRHFLNALATGQLSSGEYVIARTNARPSFPVAYPIRDPRGELVGVIAAAFALDSSHLLFDLAKLPPPANYVLVDHRGIILSRGQDADAFVGRPVLPGALQEMLSGPDADTNVSLGPTGRQHLISYRKLRLEGEAEPYMYVRVGIPIDAVLGPAQRTLALNLAALASLALLAFVGVSLVGKRTIVDRIGMLEHASRQLASGDLAGRVSEFVRGGELGRLAQTFDDMARQLAARELALIESERRSREIFEATHDGILVQEAGTGRVVEANRAATELYGYGHDEMRGMTLEQLSAGPPPHGGEEARRWIRQTVEEGPQRFEWLARRKTGELFWVEVGLSATRIGGEGRVLAVVRDIDARRRAEEEMQGLQAQLLHAQKLESIGRLAGGVAHDFNNMLSVILGEAELIQSQLPEGHPCRDAAQEIARAGMRSRDITRQLLAFSRKQVIAPREVNLNDLVQSTRLALARLIGEDVALVFREGPGLWPVRLDPAQFDQVLVNLVVNARDAMPDGGTLTIETANVEIDAAWARERLGAAPGPYVMLAVRDDGTGMDEKTLAHLFEPFFTTKDAGKGTGLGLATVYGIIQQNGGFIEVASEPGRGTTFRIHLPRAASPARAAVAEAHPPAAAGRGTVLLVEDEELVRGTATRMLEALGYAVLQAGSPEEALALCQRPEVRFDLLLTDVVMPGMKGTELQRRVAALRPGIKTLFMSGYTADVVVRQGDTEAGIHFLHKPFVLRDLARKVREAFG
jgi:PAS domain S-box-containing protein